MTTEMIVVAGITLVCIMPILIIGIVQYRSKKPVGFWSGVEPPKEEEITDLKAYNQKHGLMWIFYGIGFILCFLSGFFFGGNIAAFLGMAEIIGGIFLMIAYHNRLNRRYYRKKEEK